MVEEGQPVQPVYVFNPLVLGGILLIFLGMLLVFIGFLLGTGVVRGRTEGGAVVIIGPFPILIASSERAAKTLMILALIFFAFTVAIFLLFYWLSRQPASLPASTTASLRALLQDPLPHL